MSGNIKIVEATDNFAKINKELIYNLDYKVVGIYCKIMTLGKRWELNIKGLSQALKKLNQPISEKKIREAMLVLEEEGYMKRSVNKDVHGRFQGWDYFFYAEPIPIEERTRAGKSNADTTTTDLPEMDKSVTDITDKGKRLYIDSKIQDSKIQDSRESKRNSRSSVFASLSIKNAMNQDTNEMSVLEEKKERGSLDAHSAARKKEEKNPTLAEIMAYWGDKGYKSNPGTFSLYYSARGWKDIEDWRALADLWEMREKEAGIYRRMDAEVAKAQERGERKKDTEYEEYCRRLEKEGKK